MGDAKPTDSLGTAPTQLVNCDIGGVFEALEILETL
jgi:hypothetical protein